jgi:hypothetical protein
VSTTTVDLMPQAPGPRSGRFPWLRTLVASVTAVGLTVTIALGIAAVLGTSLGVTALRIAGTGASLAIYGLFAVGSVTLRQRSLGWQVAGAVGVLCSTAAAVITVTDVWSSALNGDAAGRAILITALVGFALGFTGFLLTHQRPEDTAGIRALMIGTLAASYILTIALSIDIVVSSGSSTVTATASGATTSGVLSSSVDFGRFLGVLALLTLLGALLLPVLRRANPAFRSGPQSGGA